MTRPILTRIAGTALALGFALAAPSLEAQQATRDFSWNGRVAPGRWLYVRNLNGAIRVERGTGDRAEVTATKRARRGDPDRVRIVVDTVGDGSVLVCAFWTEESSCDEDGYRARGNDNWRGDNNNDTQVEFTVRLPEGVKLGVSTINGALRIDGATSEVRAETTNGRVQATSTGGPVRASSVNGDLDIRMRALGETGDLEYSTVNGSILVEVPDGLNADVDMRTVNGSLNADFPITLSGRVNPRHLRATIGRGGRRLRFETINGSVTLRKGAA